MNGSNLDHLRDYTERDYADYWKQGRHMDIVKEQESRIVSSLLPPSEGWFADFGSGAGRFVPECRHGKRRLILVDVALGAIQQGRASYPDEDLWGVTADIGRLPFRDNVISGALAVRLIQNSDNPLPLLKEMQRVLRPGAYLVISFFNRRSLMRLLRFGPRCFKATHGFEHKAAWGNMFGTHPKYFTGLVKHAGFDLAGGSLGSGFSYQITNNSRICRLLVEKSGGLQNILSRIGASVDGYLGSRGLSLWQFVLLRKPASGNVVTTGESADITDILKCPSCGREGFLREAGKITCTGCQMPFNKEGTVFDMLADGSGAVLQGKGPMRAVSC